jgi:hypothetical protein
VQNESLQYITNELPLRMMDDLPEEKNGLPSLLIVAGTVMCQNN